MVVVNFTEKLGNCSMTVTIEENNANLVITEVDRLARVGLIAPGFYKPNQEEE